jgi:hypothetical protein
VHRPDLADIDRMKLDAGKGAAVVQIGDIGELAAKAVERLDKDGIKATSIEVSQQPLVSRSKPGSAACRGIGVGGNNRPPCRRA